MVKTVCAEHSGFSTALQAIQADINEIKLHYQNQIKLSWIVIGALVAALTGKDILSAILGA